MRLFGPMIVLMLVEIALFITLGGAMVAFAHLINLRLNHWHVHDATCAH